MVDIMVLDIKDIEEVKINNVEFTTENIFTDIMEDGVDIVNGAFNFLSHVVTLDLYKYFEDRHHSGIAISLQGARRYVSNNIDTIDFTSELEETVYVSPGFNFRTKLMVDILVDEFEDRMNLTNSLMSEFSSELGKIISSTKYRNGDESPKELLAIEAKAIKSNNLTVMELDKKISNILGTRATIAMGDLVPTIEELKSNLTNLENVMKKGSERDLKDLLKAVNNMNNRIKAVQKLIKDKSINGDIMDKFESLVVYFANNITLIGKLYHSLYESSVIMTKVVNNHLK